MEVSDQIVYVFLVNHTVVEFDSCVLVVGVRADFYGGCVGGV